LKIRSIISNPNAATDDLSVADLNLGEPQKSELDTARRIHSTPQDLFVPGAQWVRKTQDGMPITLRVVSPVDRDLLRGFCDGLAEHVIERRFNQVVVSDANLDRMLENTGGLTILGMKNKQPVALTEYYDTTEPGSDYRKCEIAVLVHQDHQRSGIGKTLVNELMRIAKSRGYQRIEWLALVSNTPVQRLSKETGAHFRPFKHDRSYRQAFVPVWFSGLGRVAQQKILSLLSMTDRENLIKADPAIARMQDRPVLSKISEVPRPNDTKNTPKL
jgi:RimJ/RimL family protein N-acetyltransferase